MRNLPLLTLFACGLLSSCYGDPPVVGAEDMGERDTIDFVLKDMGTPATLVGVLIEDLTQPGEGLPLDAVELCDVLGRDCVPLDEVLSSSGTTSDYSGASDGVGTQDPMCDDSTFTRMAPGDTVTFGRTGTTLGSSAKVNVWVGWLDCPLIAPGAKPFRISIVDDAGEVTEVETCEGTCTVSVP